MSSLRQGKESHRRLSRLPMQAGGATYTMNTDLNLTDSTILGCSATRGGAVYVASGSASLARSNVSDCSASQSGGGLYSAGGRTSLSDGSLISSCSAPKGRSIFLLAGEISYALPAPAGRWLPNARCEVYRQGCAYDLGAGSGGGLQILCLAHRDDCALTESDAIEPSSDEKEAACRRQTDKDKQAACDVDEPWYCQAATNVQPCNWEDDSSLLGKNLYQLPLQHVDQDFPFACAAGLLGSADPEDQSSSSCAGRCPAGSQCPEEATYETQPCDAGHYCPVGTSVPRPCLAGTFSNATNLTAAGECTDTSPGYFATTGSTEQTPCREGSFAAEERSATCQLCTEGSYQNETGATSCIDCEPGSYGAAAGSALCLLCPPGEVSNLSGSVGCTACGAGTFSGSPGGTTCEVCSSGGYCTGTDSYGGGFTPCEAGTYNEQPGSSSPDVCQPCRRGTSSPTAGADSSETCASCRAGTFGGEPGLSECKDCPAGSYSNNGSHSCDECEAGYYAANPGQGQCIPCPHPLSSKSGDKTCAICKEGFYLKDASALPTDVFQKPTEYCKSCPRHANCSAGTALASLGVDVGFWRASDATSELHRCDSETCSGVSGQPSLGHHFTDGGGDPYCSAGHTGPLCEWCVSDKQYFSRAERRCADCPTGGRFGILAGVVVALAGTALLSYRALARTEAWGRFSARLDIVESQVGDGPPAPLPGHAIPTLLHVTCRRLSA